MRLVRLVVDTHRGFPVLVVVHPIPAGGVFEAVWSWKRGPL